MPTLSITRSIYLDADKSGGIEALLDGTKSSMTSQPLSFVAGDVFPISVAFRTKATDGGASTALTPPAGSTLVVAGKVAGADGVILFSATLAISTDFFVGTLNLNTSEVAATTSALLHGASVAIYIDFELTSGANSSSYRTNAQLYKQVYAGEATPGATALPGARIASPDGSVWQLGILDDGTPTFTKVS